MNKETIEQIWTEITHSGKGEFEYQLLSKKSVPQINIGFNQKEKRCLILELPLNYNEPFQQFEKENLSLMYFSKERCLCIILNDIFFVDLFDDLILSTYCKINQVSNPAEYSALFVNHFIKWSAFFENKRSAGLSSDQVKGIFGELFYLRNLLLESKLNVDDILISWRGPYDVGHDFVFDFIDYEIKTIANTKNNVSISSEFQLESEKGKQLELVVISVILDVLNGISLKKIINEIKIIVLNKLGDNSIFFNALLQKSLSPKSLEEYEIYKFTPISEIIFDCNKDNFPKLTRPSIPEEITKVTYNIRLNLINEFIVQKKQF